MLRYGTLKPELESSSVIEVASEGGEGVEDTSGAKTFLSAQSTRSAIPETTSL